MSDELVNEWLVKAEESYKYNKVSQYVGQNFFGV
jgi:hypothetical protein